MTAPNDGTALYFAGGEWRRGEDIVLKASPEGGLLSEALESLGYVRWTEIGDPDNALYVPLTLSVHIRLEHAPRFFLSLEGRHHGHNEHIYAESLPDLMELLARWTPALQAAAVTEVVSQLNQGPTANNEWPGDRGVVALLRWLTSRSNG